MIEAGLMPHQLDALDWAASKRGPLFINDDPGLGKSRTGFAIASRGLAQCRGLAVAPGAILHRKLIRELAELGIKGRLLAKPLQFDPAFEGWWIVSYESIKHSLRGTLLALAPSLDAVVFDESHYLKGPKAQRKKAWQGFRHQLRDDCRLLLMSGTPIPHGPIDIISQYEVAGLRQEARMLRRNLRWERHEYLDITICAGWRCDNTANRILAQRRIRRRKADVLKELPPMIHDTIDVPVSSRRLRAAVEQAVTANRTERADALLAIDDYFDGRRGQPSPLALRIIQAALYHSSVLKAEPVAEYVADLAAAEPVVVFGHHHEPLYRLRDELHRRKIGCTACTDDLTAAQREAAAQDFAAGNVPVFAATYGTAGVGIELTAARRMVILEQSWSPASMRQAFDRIHRIGQEGATYADVAIGEGDGSSLLRIERALAANHRRKIQAAEGAGYIGSLSDAVNSQSHHRNERAFI